jgi:hypothetical protein
LIKAGKRVQQQETKDLKNDTSSSLISKMSLGIAMNLD